MTSFLRRSRIVDVVETTALSRNGALHVVKIGEAYVLIGRTDKHITMLGDVPVSAVKSGAPTSAPPAPSSSSVLPLRSRK